MRVSTLTQNYTDCLTVADRGVSALIITFVKTIDTVFVSHPSMRVNNYCFVIKFRSMRNRITLHRDLAEESHIYLLDGTVSTHLI